MSLWDRIKEQPTIVIQTVQVLLGLAVAFNIVSMTDNQTAAVLAVTTAVLGFILALATRQFAWPVVTGVVQAAVVLLLEFGINLTDQQVGAIFAATAALGAFFVQRSVTPETKLPALAPSR